MTYKLTNNTTIIRLQDNAFIPADPANTDYRDYLAWVAEGNTAEAADPVPPPSVTVTFREFMALFTPAEQAAIVNSTETQVKIFLLQASASAITLSDPVVKTDLDYLVSLGLITTDREAAILANQLPNVLK